MKKSKKVSFMENLEVFYIGLQISKHFIRQQTTYFVLCRHCEGELLCNKLELIKRVIELRYSQACIFQVVPLGKHCLSIYSFTRVCAVRVLTGFFMQFVVRTRTCTRNICANIHICDGGKSIEQSVNLKYIEYHLSEILHFI